MDADNQHCPKEIYLFNQIDKNIDIVLGRRSFNRNMPIHRIVSNYITSLLVSILCRKRIYDSQSGFRRYKILSFVNNNYLENGFQFETEVLLYKSLNYKIQHVNISTIYQNEISSINNIKDTLKFIKLILRFLFK